MRTTAGDVLFVVWQWKGWLIFSWGIVTAVLEQTRMDNCLDRLPYSQDASWVCSSVEMGSDGEAAIVCATALGVLGALAGAVLTAHAARSSGCLAAAAVRVKSSVAYRRVVWAASLFVIAVAVALLSGANRVYALGLARVSFAVLISVWVINDYRVADPLQAVDAFDGALAGLALREGLMGIDRLILHRTAADGAYQAMHATTAMY